MLSYLFASQNTSAPPIASPASRSEETEIFVLPGKRAVIVEDEGVTQLQLTKILRSAGIQVVGKAARPKQHVQPGQKLARGRRLERRQRFGIFACGNRSAQERGEPARCAGIPRSLLFTGHFGIFAFR